MSVLLEKELLRKLDYYNLISYLRYSSVWNEVSARHGWHVFVSNKSVTGVEIELALPDEQDEHTSPIYIATAIDVLSQLNNEQPEFTIERIDKYESDVLLGINTIKDVDSLPFGIAAAQILELQNIIKTTTDLETRENVPYDTKAHSKRANEIVNHFRFGHTFRGSFGMRIESPLRDSFEKSLTRALPTFSNEENKPLSRRIMERLARGFKHVVDAEKAESSAPIVNNYMYGFNANICKSLGVIGNSTPFDLEYKIMWSPIFDPVDDVKDSQSFKLNNTAFAYVQYAEEKLKSLNEYTTVEIRGLVQSLGSDKDPLGSSSKRTIEVKWINRPDTNRAAKISMELSAADYVLADRAHITWSIVLAEGEYKRTSQGFVLENVRNFRIAEDE
ncbi:MAG: hypothetical protein CL608_14490 [Anaerolineaceae bacterium]|nr:hypothetical protein [Anaerolineaceae bacterium]